MERNMKRNATYTVADNFDAVNGTCLQGYITTDYATLLATFGESLGGGDKTTQEWILIGEDGTVATIYDWKYDTTPMHKCEWNIGGESRKAVELVQDALMGYALNAGDMYQGA
jgi:hypothetical protein